MQFGLMHCGGGLLVVLVYLASAPLSCAIHTYRPSQAARPKTNGQQEEHVLPAHTPENASNSTASPDPVPAKPSIVQPQPAGKPAAPDTARKPLTRPPTTPAPTTSNHSRGTHNNFTYWGTNGPQSWPTLFPKSCAGSKQSPIALDYANATFQRFQPGNFMPESVELGEVELENDGMKLHISFSESFYLSGLGLKGLYQVDHVHLHWGEHVLLGSEHSLNGRHYPLEVHIVTHSVRFENVKAAVASGEREAIAVLGVFGTVGKPSSDTREWTHGLQLVQHPGCSASVESGVTPWSFLPAEECERARFYRYEGSLTAPNCSEVVVWTVFSDPLPLSAPQLDTLRSMRAAQPQQGRRNGATGTADVCAGPAMVNNFRPLQPRGDRPVYRSFDYTTAGSGCADRDDEQHDTEDEIGDDDDHNGKDNGDGDE